MLEARTTVQVPVVQVPVAQAPVAQVPEVTHVLQTRRRRPWCRWPPAEAVVGMAPAVPAAQVLVVAWEVVLVLVAQGTVAVLARAALRRHPLPRRRPPRTCPLRIVLRT